MYLEEVCIVADMILFRTEAIYTVINFEELAKSQEDDANLKIIFYNEKTLKFSKRYKDIDTAAFKLS